MIVAAISALVLIAGLVVAGVMYLKVRDADRAQNDRADAVNAAEQFALRMDSFNGADLNDYINSITPLLTTKEKTVFSQQFTQFKGVFDQAKAAASKLGTQPGKGRIQLAGVADSDADSATVLVAHDSTIAGQSEALHFRWTVSLRKVGGKWLVDDFVPVG